MSRITITAVKSAAASLARVLGEYGIITEGADTLVSAGSATNGVAWGIYWRPAGKDVAWERMPCVDLAGCRTAAQTYERLTVATYALGQARILTRAHVRKGR